MATRTRRKVRPHLYLEEWIAYRGLNPASLAAKMKLNRTTVWRWVTEQHRLTPAKQKALADALDIEPEELWRPPPGGGPPPRRSLDAMIHNQPDEIRDMAADIVSRLIKRAF